MRSFTRSALPTSKDQITVYLSPEDKEELRKWAEAEQRSMAFLAAQAIREAISRRQQEKEKKS
jgi:predicted transcriptional regulator